MSAKYGVVSIRDIEAVLTRLRRDDLDAEDLADSYLDYCTWAHDRNSSIPTFEAWLNSSGWLE